MSEKRSLAFQRQAVEHLMAMCPDADATVIDAARQACLSLAWFERRSEITKELCRLEKAAPELAELLHQIPGAQIDSVRFKDDKEPSWR